MSGPEEPPRRLWEPMTPAPSQTVAPATTTSSVATKCPLPCAAKPIGLPHDVVMAERESSDVEVEELLPRYPKSKGKGCMDATEVPRLTKKTVDSTGAVEASLAKRDLQNSPSQEESAAKRPRTSEKRVPGGLDLGGLSMTEWDLVKDSDVPGASKAVSLDFLYGREGC